FIKQTPGATSEQLQKHAIDLFNNYPGLPAGETLLDPDTVLPERFFDLAVTLMPMRDNSGALLSPDAMRDIANSPPYWSYRTTDWVREQYEALNATDKARMFSFIPEELQMEYWNGMSQTERGAVWSATAARGDNVTSDSISAWKAAHQFIKRQNIGTQRRPRQGYPDWTE
ncbi:MAG: hypothetical protein NTY83_03210, partial [Candidatus Micrarchaeota archaeon]|nr:hypothetical protein [Candidatus Micrarchaeota archaeon]